MKKYRTQRILCDDPQNTVFEAEVTLNKTRYKTLVNSNNKITCSSESVTIFRPFFNQNIPLLKEYVWAMYLNSQNKVICVYKISEGSIGAATVDYLLIAVTAVKLLAKSVIVAHNHPSGNLQPSRADELLTEKLKNGLAFLEINLLDHVIITEDSFFSFADEGKL